MKEVFRNKAFSPAHAAIISHANSILGDYRGRYNITLRGLYYQFVGRDLFPESWQAKETGSTNNQQSYDKLGGIMTAARYGGLIDWNDLKDNTRELSGGHSGWESPGDMIRGYADYYHVDLWENQPERVELWMEKDAIEGVAGPAARRFSVPYFSCRGYSSVTAVKDAADRIGILIDNGQPVRIFHIGDHDPSGIDMTRDIEDRLKEFLGPENAELLTIERIALNIDQVRRYKLPPNPAKITDSRAHGPDGYIARYGKDSYELDAIDAPVLDRLVTAAIEGVIDFDLFREKQKEQAAGRRQIGAVARQWEAVIKRLNLDDE